MLKLYFAADSQEEAKAMAYMKRWEYHNVVRPERFVPGGAAAWDYGWCGECEDRKWVAGLHSLCHECRELLTRKREFGFRPSVEVTDGAKLSG